MTNFFEWFSRVIVSTPTHRTIASGNVAWKRCYLASYVAPDRCRGRSTTSKVRARVHAPSKPTSWSMISHPREAIIELVECFYKLWCKKYALSIAGPTARTVKLQLAGTISFLRPSTGLDSRNYFLMKNKIEMSLARNSLVPWCGG